MLAPLKLTPLSPSPTGILVFLWSGLVFLFCLSIASLVTTSEEAVHHTGLFPRGSVSWTPVNVEWRVCPDLTTALMSNFPTNMLIVLAYLDNIRDHHWLSAFTLLVLFRTADICILCAAQEHCKGVGRLTFCLETVARWSTFF